MSVSFLGANRKTRAEGDRIIKVERRNSRLGTNSMYVRAARLWNSLTRNLRAVDSRVLFKKRLRRHLLTEPNDRLNYF